MLLRFIFLMASVMGMITLAFANTEKELMVQYIDKKLDWPAENVALRVELIERGSVRKIGDHEE